MTRKQLIELLKAEIWRQGNQDYPNGFYFHHKAYDEAKPWGVIIDGTVDLGELADAILQGAIAHIEAHPEES